MSINTLKEMMGMDVADGINYPLPQLHPDALDSVENVQKYAAAKAVLNHPEVNPVLKEMNAFDTLNKFSVHPAFEMAQWIVEALSVFYADTPVSDLFYTEFPLMAEGQDLSEFGKEFLAEFTNSRMSVEPDTTRGMPEDRGWMDEIAAKFGFHNIGFKELMWLYIVNQVKNGMVDKDDMLKPKHGLAKPKDVPVTEDAIGEIVGDEVLAEVKDWYSSLESTSMIQYGSKWPEVLYNSAWNNYISSTDIEKEPIVEADDATLNNKPEPRKVPKPSAKVKADIKQRVKELENLINDYKKERHFYGDVKPAVFNAKESLEKILALINTGTLDNYKQAQIHFQKLMSPITNLFPPSLVKFLAYADDGESGVLQPVEK